jgi:hypothetical protein
MLVYIAFEIFVPNKPSVADHVKFGTITLKFSQVCTVLNGNENINPFHMVLEEKEQIFAQ